MKNTFAILCIALLAACSKSQDPHIIQSTAVICIDDLTDSFLLTPASGPILSIYDFSKNRSQEAEFKFVIVSNKLLNPIQRIHLGNAKETEKLNEEDDIHNREKLIRAFSNTVRTACADDPIRFKTEQQLDNSEVFATIMNQLRKLASSKYQKKWLLIFSDLQERSALFDAYDSENRKLLQERPEEVAKLLCKRNSPPDNLNGITVIFCYKPRNRKEDQLFLDMLNVYTPLLEQRGAKVVIQATNDNFLDHE